MSRLSKQIHPKRVRLASAADFLAGGGEMGERIRNFNWAQTPLGPVENWPQSLMTAVRIMLTSRQPIWLGWGEELIKLYNDPYKAIVGGKHPAALGQPASVVWREIWKDVSPMLETAMCGVEGTYVEEQLLIMERNGYPEETYYTFSYSPIPNDQGGVGGIICANTDDTQRVIGERQLALLRELAVKTADAKTVESACALSAECLAINPYDLPFAMIYLVEQDGARVERAGRGCGIESGRVVAPEVVNLANLDDARLWPFAEVLAANRPQLLSDLSALSDKLPDGLPTGAWDRPPHQAVILPIPAQGRTGTAGLLVVGLNPYRLFDDKYRGFLELVARQIAGSLANAQAYELERKRAEALAELDRAKTAFFSNVSHEFRTPLTLMLGPLEDLLRKANETLPAPEREQLETAHRNSLRLLKLVNTLLDFSRIEAGRIQAAYQPTDLAAFTAELAGVFRSAIEHAGLEFIIDCPPLPEPLYVDREMWEKIVFNLLSNAFKFTFAGKIEVSLRATTETAELIVRDTGSGIPTGELPHLFERFHRVRGARGRSIEGSGIGLALVQELVKLNGGTVRVESELEHGSAFIVTLPLGCAHLPADRISAARKPEPVAQMNNAYLDEMLGWLPADAVGELVNEFLKPTVPSFTSNGHAAANSQSRILLADDNADMRDYVRRLLSRECEVVAVADGAQALRAARETPFDLVLTDVMMPELDGFGLLRALRADERLKTLPVILLSARAGEEARVEGAAAGADDYLIKPFSARELLARVTTHLELARVRKASAEALRESEERLRAIFESSVVGFAVLKPDTSFEEVNDAFCTITGYAREELLGMQCVRLSPPEDAARTLESYRQLLSGERASFVIEKRYLKKDGAPIWVLNSTSVTHDAANQPLRLVIVCQDITERRKIEETLRESEERFRNMADHAPVMIWVTVPDGNCTYLSKSWYEFTGQTIDEGLGFGWLNAVHPDDRRHAEEIFAAATERREAFQMDYRLRRRDGEYRWAIDSAAPRFEMDGQFRGYIGSVIDITERKEMEDALKEADRRKDEFLAMLAHELRNPLAPIRNAAQVLKLIGTADASQRWAGEVIERQTQHLTRLVDDLLEVSRITQGKVTLTRQPLDLAAIINRAVETSRPLIESRRHQLTVALPPAPVRLEGDLTRLVQVVGNLLNNAAKYTDEGGRIRLAATLENNEAIIRVEDDGIGISADLLPHVFDLFTQADRSLDRSQGGLGIGLTLVRNLVELHGGRVEAHSEGSGCGSQFIVRLPALSATSETDDPAQSGETNQTAAPGLKVLVVEDSADSAEMMAFVLKLGGHQVRIASDGAEALEAAAVFQPQAVLCDIGLPGMNGYEVAAQLRRQPDFAQTTLIALTGYGQEDARRRAKESGFDYHLVKPVDPDALVSLLDSLYADE
ncbi:MAG TPA: PAS domain S-box protein [Blastocatellia bacterium]|nr:PAS domain S-box protein [Blastocatellia bacterium]HMV82915.1 PAS domain S-box protein [Blastocatellia bacterium]HMX25318.1 PAS domain S-box protein [Blastocatellia bacterium]HMY70448.1 PAS domain S-box protein [Blastocatellia bacterium]HMZ17056.1 PAS domain S-box protein [Blastocatellia bacterium]